MIVKPENMNFSDKTFSMIIYGSPGVGKTTLALSAPDPILLDFDRGVSRVRAEHRKATEFFFSKEVKELIDQKKMSLPKATEYMRKKYGPGMTEEDISRIHGFKSPYAEVLYDLNTSEEIEACKTIIIDTGGSLVSLLKDWAMNEKGAKTKSGEFNSLKGFGFVKAEWASFTEYIKTVLHKNVIYIFHANEGKDKDGNPIQRLVCEGSIRNSVWTPCDFGGFLQMVGDQRVICFTPEQEYFAKGCHGIVGRIHVPALTPGAKNDFITRLFETAKANIVAEAEGYNAIRAKYDEIMQIVKNIVDGVTDEQSANEAVKTIPAMEHVLTSKKEASAMLNAKAQSLGLKFNPKALRYESVKEA